MASAENCMEPPSVRQPRVNEWHRIVQTCNLTYCPTVTFVTIAAALSLRAASVRVHAACVLVFADPKKILGTGARTPTKTPRRSFLPGNSGQRPLLTQPLNCPY